LSEVFTSHTSLSEYCSRGSRFPLTVPSNKAGSCGIMLSLDLRSWRPISHMSTLSIIMHPSLGSTILKIACMRVDFPLPVRPTTPIFFLPGNVQVIFFNTDGRCSAYLICNIIFSVEDMLGKNGNRNLIHYIFFVSLILAISNLQILETYWSSFWPVSWRPAVFNHKRWFTCDICILKNSFDWYHLVFCIANVPYNWSLQDIQIDSICYC